MKKNAKIEIYGTRFCGYCTAARMLLKKKGLDYEDILLATNDQTRAEMLRRCNGSSVPQILIDDLPIGGFDELSALDQSGELDELLGLHESADNIHDKMGR